MRNLGFSDPIFNEPVSGYRKALLDVLGLGMSFTHAEGGNLYLEGGQAVFDSSSQYGTNIFGHNDPGVKSAVMAHLSDNLPNFIQPFRNDVQDRLANRLVEAAPGMNHCVFANSGAEAVEASIKMARLATRRRKILTVRNGFHGKTELALSVTGSDRYSHPLICTRDDGLVVGPGDRKSLESVLEAGDVAALLFEPVLGEGGMVALDPEWLSFAIDCCHKHGTLVIADEVQSGLFRCGSFLYSHKLGLDIDIALLGKGLGGGLMPISAVLYKSKARSREFDRKHSSTFAGGGLACAAADHVVSRLLEDEGLPDRIGKLDAQIDRRAAALGNRVKVTGTGLMRGIYFPDVEGTGNAGLTFLANSGLLGNLVSAYLFRAHGILSVPLLSKNCALRLEPAINTEADRIDAFFDAVDDVSGLISEGRYDILFRILFGGDTSTLPGRGEAIPAYNHDDRRCHKLVSIEDGERFEFCFLSHLTQPSDVAGLLPRSVRENLAPEEIGQITEMILRIGRIDPTPSVLLSFEVEGEVTTKRGLILSSLLLPRDILRLPPSEREFLMDSYIYKAKSLGASVVGLGAYTSVVTSGGTSIAERFPEIHFTTGNTLTATATAAHLRSMMAGRTSTVAIVGARGSVGSLVTLTAALKAERLLLIGRASASLKSYRGLICLLCREAWSAGEPESGTVAASIRALSSPNPTDEEIDRVVAELCSDQIDDARIVVTDDYAAALAQADFVVSCSSEGKPFLGPEFVKPGAIVLDAARPFDFERAGQSDRTILESGMVRQPTERRYGDNNLLSSETGVALGCLSETVILSMEGVEENFMIGKEPSLDAIREIEALALRHGFSFLGDSEVSRLDIPTTDEAMHGAYEARAAAE